MAIIQTHPNAAALALAAARHFAECAAEAIADHGFFVVALAGGATPRAAYEALATLEFAARLNWEKLHVFWGDERCVAPTHEESNYRMAQEAWLRYTPIPAGQIHRIAGELAPQEAASAYEDGLREFFGQRPPRFDLILLGLGEDGHTASLFPDSKALGEKQRWVAANYVRKLAAWRVTLTAPLINQAAHVTFLVSGAAKAEALRRVLSGRYQPETLPAQLIRPTNGQLRWLMDVAAAAGL